VVYHVYLRYGTSVCCYINPTWVWTSYSRSLSYIAINILTK